MLVDKLKLLQAVLRLYCSNMSVLHWNSTGEEFNDAHRGIAEVYEDLFHKHIDDIGEFITRFDGFPANYKEVLELIESADHDFLMVDSSRLYTRKDIILLSQTMLNDTVNLISEVLDDDTLEDHINAGMKSELETILNEFDLQYRYINKRRLS